MYEKTATYYLADRKSLQRSVGRAVLTWILLIIVMSSVVAGIEDVLWGLEFSFLLIVAVIALSLPWMLAPLPVSQRLAAALSGVFGVEYVLVRVGQLEPLVLASLRGVFVFLQELVLWLWRDLGALLAWLGQWTWDEGLVLIGRPAWAVPPDVARFFAIWLEMWGRMGLLLRRSQIWLLALMRGGAAFDPAAAALAWGLIIWGLSSWAAWMTFRRYKPLAGVLPSGVVLSFVISYAGATFISLLPVVFCSLILIALSTHRARELRWSGLEMDFARDLWAKLFWIVLPISLVLVVGATFVPDSPSNKIAEWLDDLVYGDDDQTAMDTLADSLGMEQKPQPTQVVPRGGGVGLTGLPDEHPVTAGPELSNRIMMYVHTADQRPVFDEALMDFEVPVYRWRSYTYDTYTGYGWITTDTQKITYNAGSQLFDTSVMTRHRVLRQDVLRTGDKGNIVHVAGTLVSVDEPYEVSWRPMADFFGATSDVVQYSADALLPVFTEAELRESGGGYPAWISERYLQLPDVVSGRVLTLAQELVADAVLPYDKAVAIETFMRTFTYTLDVPAPPPNREVADFFLFDLQQGYCDYYATSMVVLARAVGLPARLVIGYVSGMYDPVDARYAVRESDAHAWVDIYFPDFGWIEFEPTAGRPAIQRISGMNEDPMSIPSHTDRSPLMPPPEPDPGPIVIAWRQVSPILAVLILIISLIVGATLIDNVILLVGYEGREMATQLYHRLRKHAERLRVPLRTGDTPYEFADAFAQKLDDIMWDRYIDVVLNAAVGEMRALVESYAYVWYAPRPLDADERRAVVWTWWKLRWRLWFARPWRKPLPRPEPSPLAPYARWTAQRR